MKERWPKALASAWAMSSMRVSAEERSCLEGVYVHKCYGQRNRLDCISCCVNPLRIIYVSHHNSGTRLCVSFQPQTIKWSCCISQRGGWGVGVGGGYWW